MKTGTRIVPDTPLHIPVDRVHGFQRIVNADSR